MKITKKILMKLIREEVETVSDEDIEGVVMDVLSDEGGAAGIDPIEDALEELEDDDSELPDESMEDIIGGVTGVKRHANGDYIDTTQLESKIVTKVTESRLRRFIKEEKEKILSENVRQVRRDLLENEYEKLPGGSTSYPYGRYRGDVRSTHQYVRKDGAKIPDSDMAIFQELEAEQRKDSMAALGGVYTHKLSGDGMTLTINYYRHTAG